MAASAVISALALDARPTLAATLDDAFGEATYLDQIQVTAQRRESSTLEVSSAVTVVGREEIKRQSPQTIADLLHGEPGTYVQQTTPGQGVVIIRGLKGSEVLHLVDGFRLNNAFFRNAPNQYIALIDALAADQIEVVRGPMATLYGSDAMGGVMQVLTAEPRFSGTDWQTSGALRARYSSGDDSTHGRVWFQTGREGFGISGGASYQDIGTRRVGGGDDLPFTAFSQKGGDVKLLATSNGHELTASFQYSQQPRTPRHDALVAGFGQDAPENSEFWFQPQARRFSHLRYRYIESSAFADTIELHLGEQRIIDNRSTMGYGSSNRDLESNTSTLRGFTGQLGKALGAHYLSYGWELHRDRVDSFRERININSGTTSSRPPRFPDGSTMESLGLFVADAWYASDRLHIDAGVRYSRFDVELSPTANGIGTRIRPDDVSGHAGFVYSLSDSLRLVGNAGRGFRAPNIFDLGTFGERTGNRFNIPNENLEPETVNSFDLGFKYANSQWEWEAIAFRSHYRNKITSVLTGELNQAGQELTQSRNATRLVLSGVEAGVQYAPGEDWRAYASATYSKGDEEFEGNQYAADRIPPLFGKAGVRWNFAAQWELEGWVLYAGRQDRLSPRDTSDARINPDGTAGWATLNARVGFSPRENLSLRFSAENLSDKRYREHGSGIDAVGRNLSLALDLRF